MIQHRGITTGIVIIASSALTATSIDAARVPKGVVLPNAMTSTFNQYVTCFDQSIDGSLAGRQVNLRMAVNRALAACKERRAELIKEADAALSRDPEYRDPAVRAKAIKAAFDTEDEIRRAMGDGRVLYENE